MRLPIILTVIILASVGCKEEKNTIMPEIIFFEVYSLENPTKLVEEVVIESLEALPKAVPLTVDRVHLDSNLTVTNLYVVSNSDNIHDFLLKTSFDGVEYFDTLEVYVEDIPEIGYSTDVFYNGSLAKRDSKNEYRFTFMINDK